MVAFNKVILVILYILVFVSCGVSNTKINNIYDYMLVDKVNTKCPDARFIAGLDQLQVLDNNKPLYSVNFNKVIWDCYIEKNDNGSFYLIEFIINFNILFQDEKHINSDLQNFEYLVAIIDNKKKVIDRKIYTFRFENQSGLLSFNKKSEDPIKFIISKKLVKNFSELKILLGFVIPK